MKNQLLPFSIFLSIFSQSVYAVEWNGSSDNDFNNGSNWNGGVAPGVGDVATFGQTASSVLTGDTVIGSLRVRLFSGVADVSVDTGGFTATISDTAAIRANPDGVAVANLRVSGTFELLNSDARIQSFRDSTVVLSGADISGTGNNTLRFDGDQGAVLENSSIGSFGEVRVRGVELKISGGSNVIDAPVLITSGGGGSISFGAASDKLTVESIDASVSGSWIFDLASTDSQAYIDANSLKIKRINLDVTNLSPSVNALNPVFLATYSPGQLSGSEFAGISGLAPDQRIDYNFMGLNKIAIVPEPSISIPILAGFLPLFGFRRRSRR